MSRLDERDLGRVLRWGALLALPATILAAVAHGGLPLGLLALGAWVLLGTVLALWRSVQSLAGDAELSLEEALDLAAPTAAEERKRAVLRALKDLEYERQVGKISESDFQELSARYRAEARALLEEIDEHLAAGRARAERLLADRLRASGPEVEGDAGGRAHAEGPEEQPEGAERSRTRRPATTRRCSACGARNDHDARFCKRCGAVLEGEPS